MPKGADRISFEQLGIAEMLKRYWLKVPPNQREYAWDKRYITALFQDLSEAISEPDSTYFLGSIVTVPREPGVYEVVDGQQRLATTAILLNEIRAYLESNEEPMIAASIANLLSDIDTRERARVPKLDLNVDDNSFFQSSVLQLNNDGASEPTLPSHELLQEAKALAQQHVNSIVAEHKPTAHGDILDGWVSYLLHRAVVIHLMAPSSVNAYKMFETLNDRGLRTSQADLIKNYVFGEAGNRLNEAQIKWSQMRGVLETLDESDITLTFLRQGMISMYGYLRKEHLFDRVQAIVKGPTKSVGFLATLETAAGDYVAILNPESAKWNAYPPSTRHAIKTLNLLLVKPMRPLMLAVARCFEIKEADIIFRAMISWSVRLIIAGNVRSGSVEQPLATRAMEVTEGTITTAADLAKKIESIIPNETEFEAAFATARVSKASLARYYLRSLERTASDEPEPWYVPNDDQTIINLEHVLPKKPEDNWPEYEEEEIKAYAARLGNQVLLQASVNSNLRSSSFADKKDALLQAPYKTTREVAQTDNWLPRDIEDRQRKLAQLALRAWPLINA